MAERDMRNAVEILRGKLFYVALTQVPRSDNKRLFFSIDEEYVYWNFYLDFGPLNLGHLYRFCQVLNAKLSDPRNAQKVIYFYSGSHGHRRTNAVYLVCSWLVLQHQVSPEDAFRPFKNYRYNYC
jgi:cell division cycle 14